MEVNFVLAALFVRILSPAQSIRRHSGLEALGIRKKEQFREGGFRKRTFLALSSLSHVRRSDAYVSSGFPLENWRLDNRGKFLLFVLVRNFIMLVYLVFSRGRAQKRVPCCRNRLKSITFENETENLARVSLLSSSPRVYMLCCCYFNCA